MAKGRKLVYYISGKHLGEYPNSILREHLCEHTIKKAQKRAAKLLASGFEDVKIDRMWCPQYWGQEAIFKPKGIKVIRRCDDPTTRTRKG